MGCRMINRRKMIKDSCNLCLSAIALGLIESVQSCTSTKTFKTVLVKNRILIPISMFDDRRIVITDVKEEEFNIATLKFPNGMYRSFSMQCTHANNPLMFTGNGFRCNLHGSEFSESGLVIKGPAENPLHGFITAVEENNVVVYIRE